MPYKECKELLMKIIETSNVTDEEKRILRNMIQTYEDGFDMDKLIKYQGSRQYKISCKFLTFSEKKELVKYFCMWCIENGISKGNFNLLSYLQINHLIKETEVKNFIKEMKKDE